MIWVNAYAWPDQQLRAVKSPKRLSKYSKKIFSYPCTKCTMHKPTALSRHAYTHSLITQRPVVIKRVTQHLGLLSRLPGPWVNLHWARCSRPQHWSEYNPCWYYSLYNKGKIKKEGRRNIFAIIIALVSACRRLSLSSTFQNFKHRQFIFEDHRTKLRHLLAMCASRQLLMTDRFIDALVINCDYASGLVASARSLWQTNDVAQLGRFINGSKAPRTSSIEVYRSVHINYIAVCNDTANKTQFR